MVRKRRSNRGVRRARVAAKVNPGALAPGDVIKNVIITPAADTYRLLSVKLSYAWTDIQAVIDDGLEFGFAMSDYSSAEVEECLEAQSSIDLGDLIAREQAARFVRSVGRIGGLQFGQVAGGGVQFNGGRPLKTKLNWKMSIAQTLHLWIRNSSGIVWSTGSGLTVIGDCWVVDA